MAKTDGRQELMKALWAAQFKADARSKAAYKLTDVEHWRIDLGGKRSARLEEKYLGAWRGTGEPLFYGQVKSEEFAKRWVDWALRTIRQGRVAGGEPKHVPTEKEQQTRKAREEKVLVEKTKTQGPGLYVVNANAGGESLLEKSRLANHGPYKTLDEAIERAWATYQEYLHMRFEYLLPVQVVEGPSKDAVERGGGYVWWINGRRRGAPANPRQLRMFGDRRR